MVARCLRRALKGFMRRLLRGVVLPGRVMDLYIDWRVGKHEPPEPRVLFIAYPDPGLSGDQGDLAKLKVQNLHVESLPPQSDGTFRIVVISDTHERHRLVALPRGDLLLHCGDILMSSSLAEKSRGIRVLKDFNSWLETVPCAEKVLVGGNHDAVLEHMGREEGNALFTAAKWLQDNSVEIAGLKIYGHGYSQGHSHNRAWQAQKFEVSTDCACADIVLTHHCTPDMRDTLLQMAGGPPKIWASGHQHTRHGASVLDGTLYINAAILDNHYNPVQPPFVVDLPRPRPET